MKIAVNSKANRSGKTTNNYLSAFAGPMELALDDGIISRIPDTEKARRTWQQEDPDPFTADEIAVIIADMRMNYDERVANLVEFWVLTGMRTSEIYGLKWKSVDFRSSKVKVHEVMVRGEYKATTKTSKARFVKLPKRALEILKAQRRFTLLQGEDSLVFDNPTDGKPWDDERDLRRSYWTRSLKRVGIRYRRPYELRHTNASMRLMANQKIGYAAKQMGHSVDMFIHIYARWLDSELDEQEMGKFEDLLDKMFAKKPEKLLAVSS